MGAGKQAWGWYPTGKVWVPLQVDVDGKVVVDMSAINLDDLADVSVAAPTDGYVLYWDAGTSLWKCKAAAGAGGLYGINVETLTGDKTLTPGTDKIYQYLDEGGANRIITLDTASATAGDRFVIRHNGVFDDAHYLQIKQAALVLDYIYAGAIKEFIFDGTNWVSGDLGAGEVDAKRNNIAIGYRTYAYSNGVAIGYYAMGYSDGVSIGYQSRGYSLGVAVGYFAIGQARGVALGCRADGHNYGIGIGYYANTNDKRYSIALGYYAKCERVGETSIAISWDGLQKNNVLQGRWAKTTEDATPVEMFCAGYVTSRFTIRASSVLAFDMTIVARDNVANEVARYSVHDGLIKRDGAGNTVMVSCTVVVDHEDDATWNVAVTADDTNEALIITVTGDATNPVQWAAVMNGVETHF